MKRSSPSSDGYDSETKPDVSPTPSPPPSKRARGPDKKPKVKAEGKAKANGGRPWTGAEYAALFTRVTEVGKAEAFASFPGRTKNQAYQAWR